MSLADDVAELGGETQMVSELKRWRALASTPEICSRELARLRGLVNTLQRERNEALERLGQIVRATCLT